MTPARRTTNTAGANGAASRVAPHDLEAEQALLGAALLTTDAVTAANPILNPDDFYRPRHKAIWAAIVDLVDQGHRPDPVTVAGRLADQSDDPPTVTDLVALQAATPATTIADQYARRIRDKAHRRRLITYAGTVADASYTQDDEAITAALDALEEERTAATITTDRLRQHLLTGDAIKTIPPAEPLIDGILDLNSIAALYGRSNAGKSFVAIDWALSIATGTWWQNHPVRQAPVLYIVAEGSEGFRDRVEAWQQDHNVPTVGQITWLPTAVNVFNPADTRSLISIAKDLRPALIILDTLARCILGAEENSSRDIGVVIDNLEQVKRATGACVLAIHHTGKTEGAGLRGSTALEGAVATSIEVRSSDDGALELTAAKQKNRVTGRKIRLHLATVAESCALRTWTGTPDIDLDSMPATGLEVLQILSDIDLGDGVSTALWRDSVKVPRTSFYRWVSHLVELGLAAKTGEKSQARYTITDQGKHVIRPTVPPSTHAVPWDNPSHQSHVVPQPPSPLRGEGWDRAGTGTDVGKTEPEAEADWRDEPF